MKEKPFLWAPVIFLVLILLVDKVFLLDFFRTDFLQTGNPVFYEHRKILWKQYREEWNSEKGNPSKNLPIKEREKREKKIAVALGDSRAYPFSMAGLPKEESDYWIVYNFSGPQAVIAYAYYWLEKMDESGTYPDLVYLSVSPEGFDDSKGLFYDPFLRLGSDSEFRKKHWEYIPWEAKYEFFVDKLFSFRGLQLDVKLLWERFRAGRLSEYSPDFNETMMILKYGRGEYLAYAAVANHESKLEKDAERIKNLYLSNFQIHDTQFYFLEKILLLAEKKHIPLILVWPRVYTGYRSRYEELKLTQKWWSRVAAMANKHGAYAWNGNEGDGCDLYNDASHQSVLCFQEVMKKVFKIYRSTWTDGLPRGL
jgi:hypothetical protein